MGDLLQFPRGEPEGEEPQVGYCISCGVECSWPNDNSGWPQACPNGCAPFGVQSWPPSYSGTLNPSDKTTWIFPRSDGVA